MYAGCYSSDMSIVATKFQHRTPEQIANISACARPHLQETKL